MYRDRSIRSHEPIPLRAQPVYPSFVKNVSASHPFSPTVLRRSEEWKAVRECAAAGSKPRERERSREARTAHPSSPNHIDRLIVLVRLSFVLCVCVCTLQTHHRFSSSFGDLETSINTGEPAYENSLVSNLGNRSSASPVTTLSINLINRKNNIHDEGSRTNSSRGSCIHRYGIKGMNESMRIE